MTRMQMGLNTSTSAVSWMTQIALSGLNYEKAMTYLDDVIVYGKSLKDHNKNLMESLTRLWKTNLKSNVY